MVHGKNISIIVRVGILLLIALFFSSPLWAKTVARNIKVLEADSEGIAIKRPSTLFYDPVYSEVYVTDEGNNQLVVYGADYFPKISLGKGRGLSPVFGVFTRGNLVYASVGVRSNQDRPHILVMNKALLPVRKIYFAGFEGADNFIPRDLVVSEDGTIYVVGVNSSFVIVLSTEGDYMRTIVPRVDALGVMEKARIIALDIGSNGNLYFLSAEFGKIFVYNSKEKPLYSFGKKGGVAGKLARPRGMALDEENGRIFIVDWLRHAVSAFDLNGEFLFDFGGKGLSRGWFLYPTDVCLDSHGNVLVSDTFNDRVQVFSIVEVDSEPVEDNNVIVPSVKREPFEPMNEPAEEGRPNQKSEERKLWVEDAEGTESSDF